MEVLKNEIKCHEPTLTMNILVYVYTFLYVPALTSTIIPHKIALKRYKKTCICCCVWKEGSWGQAQEGRRLHSSYFLCGHITCGLSYWIYSECLLLLLFAWVSLFACLLFPSCSGIVFLVSHCVTQINLELVRQWTALVLGFLICSTMANNETESEVYILLDTVSPHSILEYLPCLLGANTTRRHLPFHGYSLFRCQASILGTQLLWPAETKVSWEEHRWQVICCVKIQIQTQL